MKQQLGKYTQKQIDALFPHDLAASLRILADKANFLFPKEESDMSAGLAAGMIKSSMPFSFPAYLYAKFWGWISDHPQWFYKLAGVADKKDPSELVMMRKALMSVATRSALAPQGPGNQQLQTGTTP